MDTRSVILLISIIFFVSMLLRVQVIKRGTTEKENDMTKAIEVIMENFEPLMKVILKGGNATIDHELLSKYFGNSNGLHQIGDIFEGIGLGHI